MYYLGIDLGGTNIAVGVVDENNKIIARASTKTKIETADQVADGMAETAYAALKNANLTLDDVPWVGIGSPGAANRETGVIEFANNLPFKNTPLQKMLSDRMEGKKVLLENDANAAAYGEYMAGALKGADNAIAITLGTGLPAPADAAAAGKPMLPPQGLSRLQSFIWRKPRRIPRCGSWLEGISTVSADAPRLTPCVRATPSAKKLWMSTSNI